MTPQKTDMPDLEKRAFQVIELLGDDGIVFAANSHLRGNIRFFTKDLKSLLDERAAHKIREAELLVVIIEARRALKRAPFNLLMKMDDIIKQAREG